MNRTPKKAAAAAALLAIAGPAPAQTSSVQVYGLVDMSARQFQTAGAEKTWRVESGNMTTSYLGFRGVEDLGGGLKARFAIEHFLRADVGGAGRFPTDAFWARNAYVGIESGFGTVTLGRNTTPLFVSTLIFNSFGDSFGFSPSIRHYFLGAILGDTGWSNSIRYASPNFGGATVTVVGNLAEGPAVGRNLGANVLYFGGPLALTAAFQDVSNGVFGAPAGFDGQRTFQFGGSYDLTVAKLFAQYGNVKTEATDDVKTRLWQFGASVAVGGGSAIVSYGQAKTEVAGAEATRKTFSAGYDYHLSKSTDVYAVVMNDKATGLDSGTTLAAGIRLRF